MLGSPVNTKLGCELLLVVLVTDEPDEPDAPEADDLNSIQGTATCLPDPEDEERPALLEELVLLLVLLGVELLVLAPAPESEITANSSRPELGFTIVSLIDPIAVPELPNTGAPVN